MKKSKLLGILVLLLGIVLCGSCINKSPIKAFAYAPAVDWGLSHRGNEQIPTASTQGTALLNKYNGLYVADTDKKEVYLTFDLGYEAGHTGKVLDILAEHGIKGIFFLCGNYLTQDEIIGRMIAEGHSFGNHTDKHKNLPSLSDEGITTDITTLGNAYSEKFSDAKPMKFFRPPQGRFDERTLDIAKQNGLRAMMWSIAIVDWAKTPIDAKASADKIAGRIHPGAIILSHITNAGTPEMLKLLIPQLIEKGYSFGDPEKL